MAVFHITSGKLTESQGDFHHRATVIHGTDSVNILASPAFPLGRSFAVLGQDLPFFEVDVNRMAPAVSAIFDGPDLKIAQRGSGRDATGIHGEPGTTVGLDGPRSRVGTATTTKLEVSTGGVGDLVSRRSRQRNHFLATDHVLGRIHALVHTIVGLNAELEELADTGVSTEVSGRSFGRLIGS